MSKIKLQIKSIAGSILFEYEKEDNTILQTLIAAIKEGANLEGAYLYGANLEGAKDIPYIPLNCPSEGSFIGWKKVCGNLIKLEIPEDAKRLSSVSMKCRCDKARVLSVWNMRLEEEVSEVVNNAYNQNTLYKVGEMVYPDSFDEDRWNECSHGIHFFINKQDAINY